MLVVVSPAKRLSAAPAPLPPGIAAGSPRFPAQTAQLVALARSLSPDDLRRLMTLSPQLAALNCDRYARFGAQQQAPALHLFAGDTYAGLEAGSHAGQLRDVGLHVEQAALDARARPHGPRGLENPAAPVR